MRSRRYSGRNLLLFALSVCAALSVGCGGDDGDDVPKRLSTLVDGSVGCEQRVKGGGASAATGTAVAEVDDLTLAFAPATRPVAGSGRLNGLWVWKTGALLTAERVAVADVDPAQTATVRLKFDPLHKNAVFDRLSRTTRFTACYDSYLRSTAEKPTKFTRFKGEIVSKESELCLTLRVVSERSGDAVRVRLPLGREC